MRSGRAVAFTLSLGYAASTIGISPVGFEEFANLIAARLYERRGDRQAALATVRRRAYAYHRIEYLASHLREEGRLAALTGDRAGAIEPTGTASRSEDERAEERVHVIGDIEEGVHGRARNSYAGRPPM